MNSIYIYHHLGLGDHIICNGLVRTYTEKYDQIYLVVKPHNVINVKYMYRDNKKIKIMAMNDGQIKDFMNLFPNNEYKIIGHTTEYFNKFSSGIYETFDQGFYIMADIPFEYKWSKFYYERNLEKEKEVFYDILNLKDKEEYIFIHDSDERPINKNISDNIKIIKPDHKEIKIFDYLYTIEKAKEVHVMNSSFVNLIDCIQLKNDNLFYHEYARPDINAKLKLNWTIIK
jgi:hypothetical protein